MVVEKDLGSVFKEKKLQLFAVSAED